MSIFALTDDEVVEVRFLLGAHLSTNDITDAQIKYESTLGAAADYVYERILDSVDVTKIPGLSATEQAALTRARDATAESVTTFINNVLKPPQVNQFRRAIVYRCAGILTGAIRQVTSETAGSIAQRVIVETAADQQARLYKMCDEEISLVRNTFPNDVFTDTVKEPTSPVSLNLLGVTNGS